MIDEIAIGIGAVALAVSLLWFFFGKKEAEQASPTGEGVQEAVESASGNQATHEESPIEGGPGERLASSTLSIQGMTCAACVMAIEKALMRTQGVQSAAVNLASERATIAYDPLAGSRGRDDRGGTGGGVRGQSSLVHRGGQRGAGTRAGAAPASAHPQSSPGSPDSGVPVHRRQWRSL